MDKLSLYSLPKEILVKLVCEIQEDTKKQLLDSLFKKKYENLIRNLYAPENAKQIIKFLMYRGFEISCEGTGWENKTFFIEFDEGYIHLYESSKIIRYFEKGCEFSIRIKETDVNIFLEKLKVLL